MTKYRISIVACARWESDYIVEWLCYHRSIGFDHVYLYCNDDDPKELYEKIIPFIQGDDPFVTFYWFQPLGQQYLMYMHFLKNHKKETEYMIFLDVDEFVRIYVEKSVVDFIENFPVDFDAIYLNWIFFGNNGYDKRPKGSVLKNYTKRYDGLSNKMTKAITRSSSINPDLIYSGHGNAFWHYWHGIKNFSDMKIVNVLGEDMHEYYENEEKPKKYISDKDRFTKILSRAAVNHYAYKSREDFLLRTKRGTTGVFEQQRWYEEAYHSGQMDEFLAHYNRIEDRFLANYWNEYIERSYDLNVFGKRPIGRLISKGKNALQSSVSKWSLKETTHEDAAGAINGEINGVAGFHTDIENEPWWQVDLGECFGISEVRIFNRIDPPGMEMRASGLFILIGVSKEGFNEFFRHNSEVIFGGVDGRPLIFSTKIPIPGRFLRIKLPKEGCLHLDQVEVYGEPFPKELENWVIQ